MNKGLHLFFLYLLFCITTACTTEKQQMQSWMGSDKRSLIRKLGPPVRTASDGGDGEILIYCTTLYNGYNRTTIYRYKMFYANASGELYYWRTQGEAVPPAQLDITIYRR